MCLVSVYPMDRSLNVLSKSKTESHFWTCQKQFRTVKKQFEPVQKQFGPTKNRFGPIKGSGKS